MMLVSHGYDGKDKGSEPEPKPTFGADGSKLDSNGDCTYDQLRVETPSRVMETAAGTCNLHAKAADPDDGSGLPSSSATDGLAELEMAKFSPRPLYELSPRPVFIAVPRTRSFPVLEPPGRRPADRINVRELNF